MIYYVIKNVHKWTTKDKREVEHTSYFEKQTKWPLPMTHWVGEYMDAKLFDCKSEATRFIKRNLELRTRYTVERVTITPRQRYLHNAKGYVKAGMQPGAFAEKFSKDENYEEGDWLMLVNMVSKKTV